jgi:hypothetical protein
MEVDDIVRAEVSGLIFAVAQYVPSIAGLHGSACPTALDITVSMTAKTIRWFTNLIFFRTKAY